MEQETERRIVVCERSAFGLGGQGLNQVFETEKPARRSDGFSGVDEAEDAVKVAFGAA
jgi:hypothetical protein